MNPELEKVLRGFVSLKQDDKKQFFEFIKQFGDYPYLTESEIKKSLNERGTFGVNFGPVPTANSCPCCGK